MNWAVVTPSYNLDFERCKLLCRSMDAFLTGPWHHYIVVDPVDMILFAPLGGPRRSIINKANILPRGMYYIGKVPFMRLGRLWWSWRHGPVFGWQMQQFVKILMAASVKEEAIVICDSDIFFVRPFDISKLGRGNQVRFGVIESPQGMDHPLVRNSVKLMALPLDQPLKVVLDDQIMTWHRPTVLAMQDHLSSLHGKPWHEAIGSKLMFSEFQMYALFVEYIQKNNPHIYRDNTHYCKTLWTKELANEVDLADFCSDLEPEHVAVCIQSLIGIKQEVIEKQFETALARNIPHDRKVTKGRKAKTPPNSR